jgi:hypothetical protein
MLQLWDIVAKCFLLFTDSKSCIGNYVAVSIRPHSTRFSVTNIERKAAQ